MTPQSLGFTPAEAAILQSQPDSGTLRADAGAACLDAYGGCLDAGDTFKLIVYHIRAAIDLGLADHARRLFTGLLELLDRHPELVPNLHVSTHNDADEHAAECYWTTVPDPERPPAATIGDGRAGTERLAACW